MAIKERKQITGTTAQIDDYEGHEGQIVWDKEKKTFVGMSGTAGKNYPLAPKEYVDNKVAKCLPLTGGQVTGDIVFNTGAILFSKGNGEHFRELLLGSDAKEDPSGNAGAYLALRNSGGSNESLRGTFALHTRLANSTAPFILEGKPNGELTWRGQELVRIGGGSPRQDFTIGSSGATYTSPFTGKCCIAGPVLGNGGNIEMINNFTADHCSASTLPENGWVRAQVYVRKGDTVTIFYYNWVKKDAYWIGS